MLSLGERVGMRVIDADAARDRCSAANRAAPTEFAWPIGRGTTD